MWFAGICLTVTKPQVFMRILENQNYGFLELNREHQPGT